MGKAMRGEDNQYLTFLLDDEAFAVSISGVREVLEFSEVTKVPRMPIYMRGVINLRGAVVPVLDLKARFALGRTTKNVSTCIIIVEVQLDGEAVVLGMMADAVQEVFALAANEIEPPPKLGTRLDTQFVRGMGKRGDEFLIVLDIDRVFLADEAWAALDASVPGAAIVNVHEQGVPATM